jgi:hypothetical protein
MLDARPTKQRVDDGIATENHVVRVLVEKYNFPLEDVSAHEDMVNKTDRLFRHPRSGRRDRVAVKSRDTQNDILVAVRDPWKGPNNPHEQIGRDMLVPYYLYITVSKDRKTIRVAHGKAIHDICNGMMEELAASGWCLDGDCRIFDSERHRGCQLRYHIDRFYGHAKILAFIPPHCASLKNKIKYYKMLSFEELDALKESKII